MKPLSVIAKRCRGFSLIELLVSISIIALLFAILMPALSAARREGQRTFCLSSLRQLALASVGYAQDDRYAQMLAAPTNADEVALIDGIYDYGGDNCSVENPDSPLMTVWGENTSNNAGNRPLNKQLFGADGGQPKYAVFRCPGDDGWVEAPEQPRSLAYAGFVGQPFWRATGTSYRANCCRASGLGEPALNAPMSYYRGLPGVYSMGPYMRSTSKLVGVTELVLYCESIMWEALWNSRAIDGTPYANLPGWHGKMTMFNAVFFDGHAATVQLTKDNPEVNPEALWERGPNWRFDTMPEPLLDDFGGISDAQ